MLFCNMDFNFAHFSNFSFTYFEIEESFGLVLDKITKRLISLANFQFGYLKGACLRYGVYLCSFYV